MRLLVTGGLGFIGSNFIRLTLQTSKETSILNVDNLSYGSNPANLKDTEEDKRYHFVKGDICDEKLIQSSLEDVDVVINFAAQTHVDRSISNPRAFVDSNILGVLNLLNLTRNSEVGRFLQVSTDEVYGSAPPSYSFKEEDALNPSSPYSASKASADLLVQAFHKTYGLNTTITRCTNNFGPYQFPEKLIPKTTIRALLGLKIPIYGSGRQVRDWIHVNDFCNAIHIILEKGRSGETYNVSSNNELQNIEIAKKILSYLGKPHDLIEFVEDRPGHDIRYSLDSTKIREELGWRPRYDFDPALRKTIRWYTENEQWWRPIISEDILHPTPWKLRW